MQQALRRHLILPYTISLGLMTVLLSLIQPIPSVSAQQLTGPISQEAGGTVTQERRIENLNPTSPYTVRILERKDTQTSTRKLHRLIRKPQNDPVASVEPSPSDSSPVSSVPTPAPSLQSDTTTVQSKEPLSLNRSVGTAVPLATISVAPSPATAAGLTAAGTVQTRTIPLAAPVNGKSNSSTSGNGNTGGRSMNKLVEEMPALTQLTSPPSAPVLSVNPAIGMSPISLSFTAQQGGGNPAPQTLTISNTGGGTLSWSASDSATWLSLSPASGTGNGAVTATVATSTMTAGSYSGTVTLTATGATPVTVPVSLTVTAASTLTLSPSSLSYAATQGAANPANQNIALTNAGGTLNWTVSDSALWLAVSPASGSGNSTLTTSVNTAGLSAGTYNGTITVSAAGASSKTVAITLTVSAPATSSATLTWNAVTASDLAGYKIYRATTSGGYGAPIATVQGNVTTYIASGLQSGTTYFFVITSYDTAGNESSFSNEVSKSIF